MDSFDDAYANYLKLLAKLDRVDDVAEKNLLFRQLAQLLSELEQGLRSKGAPGSGRDELAYWL